MTHIRRLSVGSDAQKRRFSHMDHFQGHQNPWHKNFARPEIIFIYPSGTNLRFPKMVSFFLIKKCDDAMTHIHT